MHKQKGYILFLLFSILSVCSVLIAISFGKVVVYQKVMRQMMQQQQALLISESGVAFIQALMTPEQEKKEESDTQKKDQTKQSVVQQTMLKIYPYFNKEKTISLTQEHDGINGSLALFLQSEQGKLNLNSLFDIKHKKFVHQGQPDDRKKICTWLFGRIAAITGQKSLMEPFEQFISNRKTPVYDVTELLSIKEFKDQFADAVYVDPSDPQFNKKIYLTDIFTVCTEQDTISPWLFSHSWCVILELNPKQNLETEELKKIIEKFKDSAKWDSDWNLFLQPFYNKEYKDLAQDIKSILTTQYEANIFSLLLKAKIGETNSSIFTIVKVNSKQHLMRFDTIKTSQI